MKKLRCFRWNNSGKNNCSLNLCRNCQKPSGLFYMRRGFGLCTSLTWRIDVTLDGFWAFVDLFTDKLDCIFTFHIIFNCLLINIANEISLVSSKQFSIRFKMAKNIHPKPQAYDARDFFFGYEQMGELFRIGYNEVFNVMNDTIPCSTMRSLQGVLPHRVEICLVDTHNFLR